MSPSDRDPVEKSEEGRNLERKKKRVGISMLIFIE